MKLEGKRKLLGFLILIGLSATMVFVDKMPADKWTWFSIIIYGILTGGNGLEWITKLKGAGK